MVILCKHTTRWLRFLNRTRWGILFLLVFWAPQFARVSGQPGFISLDCGGTHNFTDIKGINWMPDESFIDGGASANIMVNVSNEQYQTVRSFGRSQPKYCYTLPVNPASRYLVRATFLYGNFDNASTFPLFNISLDATMWATITIDNATQLYFQEIIVSTQSRESVYVCIISGTVGTPFISTLELRQLQGSMYAKDNDATAYLKYAQRINYGAPNTDFVRYPDDPVDRIWESDIAIKGRTLTHEADGTLRINTTVNVTNSQTQERPPSKVMETAVVGSYGKLTYRLNLPGFPGTAWAKAFLAEIQVLNSNETRKFTFTLSNDPTFKNKTFDIAQDVGDFIASEAGYDTIELPQLVDFEYVETNDSSQGPILNAMEILQVISIVESTNAQDASVLAAFRTRSENSTRSLEEGDPCLPVPLDWVNCSATSTPRVTGIVLSSRNLIGVIPSGISEVLSLDNLWLDNNSLNGSIPDLSQLLNLTIVHLENNQLSGSFPQYFAQLPKLEQLFVQGNNLSGTIPKSLLKMTNLKFEYYGNPNLKQESVEGSPWRLIVGVVLGGATVLIAAFGALYFLLFRNMQRFTTQADGQKLNRAPESPPPSQVHLLHLTADTKEPAMIDTARSFSFTELYEATEKFSRKIGQGGFGPVYYGRLKNGLEIAVKNLSADSYQGEREFLNEVTLLSRIHHRNLVTLYGYCRENNERMLVYEYMLEGSLRDHLHGPGAKKKLVDWKTRLQMALDAAKGLEYLHTGCNPAIIHRDVKSSNILIDGNMKAKVSDFGLSKDVVEGVTHVSSAVRGTFGYVDPEYYYSLQLTEKSDVYSFGIVLLEVISGKYPISAAHFGTDTSIVQWARHLLQQGYIAGLIDPVLEANYTLEAAWKVAEIAIYCVEPVGLSRPSMSKVVHDLREAITIEKNHQTAACGDGLETLPRPSGSSSTLSSPGLSQIYKYDTSNPASSASYNSPNIQPSLR